MLRLKSFGAIRVNGLDNAILACKLMEPSLDLLETSLEA
jgi:hypothetical protein